MDKRILAAGGAGLLAVILAIFLVGRPDTGGDVVEREIVREVDVPAAGGSDEIVRGGEGGSASLGGAEPSTSGPAGVPGGPVDVGAGAIKPIPLGQLPPQKLDAVLRQQTPEAEWAARAMAPWTEIRRQLALQGADDELVDRVQGLVTDIRSMRIDGTSRDYGELAATQEALEAEIRSSGMANEDIERLFVRLAERHEQYASGMYDIER